MPRGATKRTWVKFHVTGWLHGTIRYQLTPAERSVWADLICLAGQCGQNGSITDNNGHAYPDEYLAGQLNIPLELLNTTIEKCREDGRVSKNGAIKIMNWDVYQSEYERQKPYRQSKRKHENVSTLTAADLGVSFHEMSQMSEQERRELAIEKGLM